MQIDGNYNSNYQSYSNSNYTTHTHHFTECLHEEQPLKKPEVGAAAPGGVTLEINSSSALQKNGEIGSGMQLQADTGGLGSKILGFFREIWDSMGKSGSSNRDNMAVYEPEDTISRKSLWRGVHAVLSGIKQGFNMQIAERFETVRERLKVGIHTSLKRFGKGSEPFSALTDSGEDSLLGGKAGSGAGRNRKEEGTRQGKNEPIKTIKTANEHLMDSYSKSGTYCKLNENLTYQQGRAPYKVSDRGELHK